MIANTGGEKKPATIASLLCTLVHQTTEMRLTLLKKKFRQATSETEKKERQHSIHRKGSLSIV